MQRFPQAVQVPGPVRLPVSLSDGDGALLQEVPATLGAQVLDEQGAALGERIEAVRRDAVPAPYYDFHTTLETPGFYSLQVEGGQPEGASFDVADPSKVVVPIPGQPLPPLDTPTVAAPAGVDPICTREPEACPFHDITLTEALASGKQVAYYVGTPAFCTTGVCAPGLESLIEVHDDYADTHVFVHAEVYTDDTGDDADPGRGRAAPVLRTGAVRHRHRWRDPRTDRRRVQHGRVGRGARPLTGLTPGVTTRRRGSGPGYVAVS